MQIINVDLVPGKVMPILHASQFDVGRSLGVKLYNGGAVYDLTGAEVVSISVRKPDGNIVTETLTNAGGNELEIITTEQMTACAGASLCEIKIEDSGDVIGSANFVLEVEEDPLDGGIASQSEIDNLATQIADINNDIVPPLVVAEVANQYDSGNVIFDNEPTTGHGNGYTVTSEGIENAIDNALDMTDTASGAIATFESEYALPLRDLEIEINAVQEAGTPTPSSPKLISGFTGANIHVADDETPHVIDNVTAISWQSEAGTVYGGSLDVTTGVLTVTHGIKLVKYSEGQALTIEGVLLFRFEINDIKESSLTRSFICSHFFKPSGFIGQTPSQNGMITNQYYNTYNVCMRNDALTTAKEWQTWLTAEEANGTPVQLVYELATPVTYQLTPTQISAIVGTNNVFTDTNGDTSLEYYTKRGEQTVRIAEGVAVDVINNKNIDNLTTTNKTLVGAVNEVDGAVSAIGTALNGKADSSSLATVATSGNYSDLSNKPTIDSALDNTSENAVQNKAIATAIGNLSSLATTHKDSLVNAVNDVNTKVGTKADSSTALKREDGSGAGSGQTFTMETGGSTNACWLVFFGGTYVGVITIFNTSIAIAKLAGSLTATASLSGTTITISLSGAPWTQLRYVKL